MISKLKKGKVFGKLNELYPGNCETDHLDLTKSDKIQNLNTVNLMNKQKKTKFR